MSAVSSTDPEIRLLAERRLAPEEFRAWVEAPMNEAERAEILSLHAWFVRRYPTPAARLAAIRRSLANAARLSAAGRAR